MRSAGRSSARTGKFGTEFIVLPNPMYGDWESGLARDYNKLTPPQKLQVRQQAINARRGR